MGWPIKDPMRQQNAGTPGHPWTGRGPGGRCGCKRGQVRSGALHHHAGLVCAKYPRENIQILLFAYSCRPRWLVTRITHVIELLKSDSTGLQQFRYAMSGFTSTRRSECYPVESWRSLEPIYDHIDQTTIRAAGLYQQASSQSTQAIQII